MLFETEGRLPKEDLNPSTILSRVSELDIFHYYISTFKRVGAAFCSELRRDKAPSCTIYTTASGKAIYKDFATGDSLNCFQYVMAKYGCDFNICLRKIANDILKLSDGKYLPAKLPEESVKSNNEKVQTQIGIVSVPLSAEGEQYWAQYGVTSDILDLYNVKEIAHFRVKGYPVQITKAEKYAFAYCFGNYRYKIVRPNIMDINRKWVSNVSFKIVQGLPAIPLKGNLLVITKALKDVMTLRSLGVDAIAPQSENTQLPKRIIELIKQRYTFPVIYYDNDSPGIKAAQSHSLLYGMEYIHNSKDLPKDASDLYKERGREVFTKILAKLLENVGYDFYSRKCALSEEQQDKDQQGDIPF